MGKPLIEVKRVLAVDDEPDVLATLEEEIMNAFPTCIVEKASTYEEANRLLLSYEYDAVVLDIMGVRGFDLLRTAAGRNFKVAMLTAHALSPEALKESHRLGARAYIPKDKLGQIVPFINDMLEYDFKTGWERLLERLESYFAARFPKDWAEGILKSW